VERWLAIDQKVHSSPEALESDIAADEAAGEPAKPKWRFKPGWLIGPIVLLVVATVVFERTPRTESPDTAPKHQQGPVPVTVTAATTADVPVYLDGLGTVQAANAVAIRSQVDGKLQSVNFVEGQQVHKGDTLAVVDQRPFQATVDQAKAKKLEDQAQLVSEQKDLVRFKELLTKGAGTAQAVDQQQAKVDDLQATIAADDAGIEAAETQLSYATITAPMDGKVGFRQVDAGNIVHASDQTPITMLTQIKPAMAVFTLPQRDLEPVREAMRQGKVKVLALDQDKTKQLAAGELLLIDNQIDQTTSTIRLKASFPNADERLWPGEFVEVRVLVDTLVNAVTIPSAALERSQDGLFVWVIGKDDTAEMRPVTAGPSIGDMTVVASGLRAGERVVVSGQYRLKPGAMVDAKEPSTPVAEKLAP
jgi:membrane fusion protein, multidrug efflux system